MKTYDIIIIGAGAAGLFCAIEAGKRGRKVLVLDHANKPGKKILMAGGGRCNFTNLHISPEKFISQNPHFCKSALSRYTQWDFIELVDRYKIDYHEKTLGQLFCDHKSQDILKMLLNECEKSQVNIQLHTSVNAIKQANNIFSLHTSSGKFQCESLVIATGGLSIPTMGASPFGYQVAEQFNIPVHPTRAGLVPFTLQPQEKQQFSELSGIAMDAIVDCNQQSFRENILLTHRGLSGPAILQISSYWQPGESINISLLPETVLENELITQRSTSPNQKLKTILNLYFPRRSLTAFISESLLDSTLQTLTNEKLKNVADCFQQWRVKPSGTEGYRTAEVTLGGVDCNAISSKTMQANAVQGLYFIGEVLDVTGWLGGYNFQWAWSSGWAAGQVA